ncbi:Ig-like domain-containing protein [uncultured Eubacterium sp.]|uniref:Ig-like domain-containing protein n=1 Tax=uncultured Eubacterium sp. TaxID=165185 RepID=UPI002592F016|nr:Ig-like domain-containing protein [uncultured Eubacterium sp.]
MSINLTGNLSGQIEDMLQGSVAGNISLLGGRTPVIEPKTITENGTYTAPEGVDGYNPIDVLVSPLLEDRYINANGQYGPTEGYDGIRRLTVEVPVPSISPVTITENGTYTNPSGNGYNPITVNVPASTTIISSNDGKYKLGIVTLNNDNELVLTFSDVTINQIENMDIFTNQKLPIGLNKTTLKLCKAYDSPAQTNQIGFVGFYRDTLRAWNLDQSQNILLEHAYCSLILSDATPQQDNPYIEL